MAKLLSKKELKELERIEGEARGCALKNYANFIIKKEGKEALNKLENHMEELGHPIKYGEVKAILFYPIKTEVITLLLIKKLFRYGEEDFQEMASYILRVPFIMRRVFMSYLGLVKTAEDYLGILGRFIKKVPKMWNIFYSIGRLEVVELNKEEKFLRLRLKDFFSHPIHCQVLKGYILGGTKIVFKKKTSCQETKCIYRGDKYHEYLVSW